MSLNKDHKQKADRNLCKNNQYPDHSERRSSFVKQTARRSIVEPANIHGESTMGVCDDDQVCSNIL